jgi:hypothetical protein
VKKFFGYIKTFIKEELSIGYLLFLMAFLAVAIYWAYPDTHYHQYREFRMDGILKMGKWFGEVLPFNIEPNRANNWGMFGYHMFLYGIPFLTAYLGYIVFRKRFDLLKNGKFWLLCLFAIGVFAFRQSSGPIADAITQDWSFEQFPNFWRKLFRDLFRMAAAMVPVTIYWLWDRKSASTPYGFTLKNFNLKPYFVMLLIMLPFVIGFGLTDHFGGYYPRGLKNLNYYFGYGVDPPQSNLLIYELVYGLDFVSIEYFFRGFLVIAFIRFVGPGAILPMASFYVFIHFGKPMVETISSFFGGSLLGILAFYSRSIWGGIVVHMGIAWLMELGAYLGKVSN